MKTFISKTAIVKDSNIGDGTKIWEFANVHGCKIGNNVTISSHSFICSLVTIEDDVFIGHGVITINDRYPPSYKRTGTTEYWQELLIKKASVIGSNATLLPVIVGEKVEVGAESVVTKDVPDNCIVAEDPARVTKSKEN